MPQIVTNFMGALGFLVRAALSIALLVLFCLVLVRHSIASRKAAAGVADESSPYVDQFPPSRRHMLARLRDSKRSLLPLLQLPTGGPAEISAATLRKRALPVMKTMDLDQAARGRGDRYYTPTGFSVGEVRALLGRFPDYALLSGVRAPTPCGPDFDISRAVFRPFRPFRWKYHQNMSLMKFDPDYWVELEQNYVESMAERQALLERHGDRIFFCEPGAEPACRELMEMVVQFLCTRYPRYFSLECQEGDEHVVLVNRLLGTRTDVSPTSSTNPLSAVFANVPEDYALMVRNEADGKYYLRAAAVCSSVGWDVAAHRAEPLGLVHAAVPRYHSFALSMDRFFARLPTDAPIQRCSWSIEDWAPLFSSPHVHAASPSAPSWQRSAFAQDPAAVTLADLHLRCDWQTLRRLPLTGAVAFNFKPVLTPLVDLRREPFVPALLRTVLAEGDADLMSYKCLDHTKKAALAALDTWADEQVKDGIVPPNWDARTLDESPFFPGWEAMWRARQKQKQPQPQLQPQQQQVPT